MEADLPLRILKKLGMWSVLAIPLLAFPMSAQAQEDSLVFNMDTVLVVPFSVSEPSVRSQANDARRIIEEALKGPFLVFDMGDVEGFARGYDAYAYMGACPPGQYLGCSFVVGGKAKVEWAISGTAVPSGSGIDIALSIMDIENTEMALEVELTVDSKSEAMLAEGITAIMARVVAGAAESTDVRGEISDEKAAILAATREAEKIAEGLENMETELGDVERLEIDRIKSVTRLSKEDLDEMEGREDGTPWDQLEMNRAEYRRYKISGLDLGKWRTRANGRAMQVLGRFGFSAGAGPYYQVFDGRYAMSNTDLSIVEVAQVQEAKTGPASMMEMELGFGVHKFVEVVGVVGFQMSSFEFVIHPEVMGNLSVLKDPTKQLVQTAVFGGRVNVIPMASYPFRPTMGLGVTSWKGSAISSFVDLTNLPIEVLDPPSRLLLQMLPGIETGAGSHVNIFARMLLDIPVAGSSYVEFQEGAAALSERPTPSGEYGAGVSFQGGIQFRLGMNKKKSSDIGPQLLYEDDDF
jgi:hypothetical protein